VTVFTGICIHLFMGNLYLWGNISNYVISYYHYRGDENARLSLGGIIIPLMITI
jgi:hypothetical protein